MERQGGWPCAVVHNGGVGDPSSLRVILSGNVWRPRRTHFSMTDRRDGPGIDPSHPMEHP